MTALPLLNEGASVILCGSTGDVKVAPGLTETPGLTELFSGADDALADLTSTVPLKRRARAEEIGSVVSLLASDASSFMTGSEVYVDGGASQF